MSKSKGNGCKIRLENVGPLADISLDLRDLTVLVGPQASGKSIFLQTLKLALDRHHIMAFFRQQNMEFNGHAAAFLDGYYGGGMGGMLDHAPFVTWAGKRSSLESLARVKKSAKHQAERLFYIPAQRVVSLPSGVSRTFAHFDFGDPYVLRYFAHQVHLLLQNEFGALTTLFPVPQRLNETIRKPLEDALFGGAELRLEQKDYTNVLALKVGGLPKSLPFLDWSAGQREFVPLLLGFYWLCPAGKASRREHIEWVVVEEPEMGLHPRAIASFLLLALELLRRGYKVIISTHSPAVLDLVWALRHIQHQGKAADVRALFDIPAGQAINAIAESALSKECRVYFFERDKPVRDISTLDPSSEDEAVYNWGDLNGFSSRSAGVVSDIISRAEWGDAKR